MDNFLGEIRLFSFTVIPKGWLPCNGQVLPIQTYAALYSLLGTQFGGDGKTTFALPDLRGRVAMAKSPSSPTQKGGSETVMLPATAIPAHSHTVQVSNSTMGNGAPAGRFPATNVSSTNSTPAQPTYVNADTSKLVALHPDTIASTPAQTPVPNMQPSICLSYCIATMGLYPSHQ
ncbi:phage tail protein [Pseudomonas sp. KU43P]|uniref:phage tail protein n=1 Tax=Pseudomonas sp. KU43P TaxID=2487887 RepID=UPI0012A8E816|nr:tail fiber protein [Pseudomonas sp. KU43P]BBH45778.1 microcystin dependent protein [Pseudomonas sp. KU43P]